MRLVGIIHRGVDRGHHVLQPERDYLMNLVDDIIQENITAFHGLKDHQIPRDYFTLLMERSGKQASINKLSNILKISPDTDTLSEESTRLRSGG